MLSLKPFQEVAPGVLEVREGGGFISIFGLPFLAAGIFVTLIGTGVVRVQNAAEVPWWAWPIILIMGLAFVAVGSALVFGRTRTRLDTGRGKVQKQWGLLMLLKTQETTLQDFAWVCLRHQPGDSDSAERFPVVLKAGQGGKDLALYSSLNYGEARQRAEFLARFLKLPLRDTSTQHVEVLQPDVRQGVLQPALTSAEPAPQAFPPQTMRSQVEERGDSAQITIPGPGFKVSMLVGVIVPICILAYVASGLLPFFRRTHTPEPVQYVFLGFLVFMLGVMPTLSFLSALLRSLRSHTRIIASREGLTIENRGALFTRRTRIPAGDILGVDYSTAGGMLAAARSEAELRCQQGSARLWQEGARPGSIPKWLEMLARLAKSKGVTVKSKAGLFSFAAGMPDDEVCYLYTVVQRALGLGRSGAGS